MSFKYRHEISRIPKFGARVLTALLLLEDARYESKHRSLTSDALESCDQAWAVHGRLGKAPAVSEEPPNNVRILLGLSNARAVISRD